MAQPEERWPGIIRADLASGKTSEQCAEGWGIPLDAVQRIAVEQPATVAPKSLGATDRDGQIADMLHDGQSPKAVAERFGLHAGSVRRAHERVCGSHSGCPHLPTAPKQSKSKPTPTGPRLRIVDNEPDDDTEPVYWETFPAWDDYPDPPPPLLTRDDGHPLIPGEGHAEILGAWGAGKSWFAQRATVEAVQAWRQVVYLRLEGHQKGLHHRLRLLGLTDDKIRDPNLFRSVTIDYLFEHQRWSEQFLCPRGVLIIDTVSKAGGSTNESEKAEEWLAENVTRFTDGGCLVVSVDHVAKHFADDLVAMSSRGSSAKTAAADFAIHVVGHRKRGKRPVPTCWGPSHNGYVDLFIAKPDRNGQIDTDGAHGAIARVRGYHDPATGGFRLDIDPPTDDDDKPEGPTPADIVHMALDILTDDDGLNYTAFVKKLGLREGVSKNKAERAVQDAKRLGYVSTAKNGASTIHTLTFEGIAHHDNNQDPLTDIS
ncbi:MAG: AAA family ATPase [Acidimicrobiaceae bacterium]|nr:AAA family ATPase [Acidimicrobiaceae bacterium]